MSYSRWSTSIWCTFHSTDKSNDILEVCRIAKFSFEEIVIDMDSCLKKCISVYNNNHGDGPTNEDIQELRECMLEFVYEIAREKLKNEKES